ncbi:MAG: helix-turn-helix transcriptional regulator, partial [Nocardioides sp.]|nr:helix-turn-helix transcriptional regulator [Nocardioides sp.]
AVKVPRAAFEERTGLSTVAEPVIVDVGPGGDIYGRALVRLVGNAVRLESSVPADEETVLDLVAVIAGEGRVSLATAHRAAAKAYIEERLGDAGLSASEIAVGAGISERHLSRLFAEAGSSVPRHILGRRLDLAYALLAEGEDPTLRTVDVAARCGFTSASYFSQAFRKRFGVPAGDVRRAALSPQGFPQSGDLCGAHA